MRVLKYKIIPLLLFSIMTFAIFLWPSQKEENTLAISVCVAAPTSGIVVFEDAGGFGTVTAGMNVFSNQAAPSGQPRIGIRNEGLSTISALQVTISSIAGGMTLGSSLGDVGEDRYVLAGIFTEGDSSIKLLDISCFANDDVLALGTYTVASTSSLADDTSTSPDGDSLKGINIPPSGERIMRFLLQTPTSATLTAQQDLTITFYNGL